MMRASVPLLLAVLCLASRGADLNSSSLAAPASPIMDPVREGQELAARLRLAVPDESSEFSGVLEITGRDGSQRFVPIVSRITVRSNRWEVIYQATPTNGTPAETLTILHSAEETNRYSLALGGKPPHSASLNHALAGSDFWLLDLGLEFFQWPQQRALRAEMSRGRPCRVLESVTSQPGPDGYARVLCWIDNEHGGVLQAEAYDRQNKLLKKFKLGGFEKVQGKWQVSDMTIRNVQTKQQTELKFDLQKR